MEYTQKSIKAGYSKTAKRLGFTVKEVKQMQFNSGYHDAANDIKNGFRNREFVKAGVLFCLPGFDPYYCEGYKTRQTEEHNARMLAFAVRDAEARAVEEAALTACNACDKPHASTKTNAAGYCADCLAAALASRERLQLAPVWQGVV